MRKLFVAALAIASAPLSAQHVHEIEHVLVSVPVHKKAAETALPVTVFSGEALRRQAGQTLGDTLANSPGLANASFGPAVGQPVIRGQAGPRVTVLQNGVSSADAANVSADHAVSVEPLLADSVEVLRGPATLLYGGGAIGGVVNVMDNRIPSTFEPGFEGAAELRHDTASSGDTAVIRLDGANGSFAWHLDGLFRDWDEVEIPGEAASEPENEGDENHADGIIENSDGRTESITLGGAYHFDEGFFGLAVSHLENEYGIPPGAHGHHDEEEHEGEEHDEDEEEEVIRLDVEQTRYDAVLHLHDPLPGLDVFRGFLTYTDYEHVELEGAEVGTRFDNETWETRLEIVHSPLQHFHGSFGLQASSGEFSAIGEEAFVPVTDSRDIGLFVVEDYHHERWTLEGGLRLDHVERDPDSGSAKKEDFSSLSLSGSILFDLDESWQLGLALMRAERAPATEELYSNVENPGPDQWIAHAATNAIELGDPDLDTEVSNNVDASLSWSADGHFATLTVFYNDFVDYISLLDTGQVVDETPVLAYANADAEFWGWEIESEFMLGSLGGGDLRLGLSADSIRGELDSGANVPRLPPRRLGVELSWEHPAWRISTGVLDAEEQNRPGPNEEATEGYTRWNAGIEYRADIRAEDELVLFLRFKNITDEEIRLSTSFLREVAPEPGRSVEGGIRLYF